MAAPTNTVKIGLFVVLGFAAALALAIAVGAARGREKTVAFYTYFNEPVTGLDLGAPVKARGVTVGRVGAIGFAPDRRMVAVRLDIRADAFDSFGGHDHAPDPDLRAQLAAQGLTGSRFVSIDFADPTGSPPPPLSFEPYAQYIPAAQSQQKTLEDSVSKAMDGLANLVDTMSREGFSEKTVQAMTTTNDALKGVDQFVKSVNGEHIPQRAAVTVDQIHRTMDKVSSALDRMNGESGLIATAQRSVSSFGEVGRNAAGPARDLDATLNEIREAAAAFRLLADELERDPDMLLKGRASRHADLP
jgi:ABC-type transporter Mla subunit MlaD